MKILELFSGTESFSKVGRELNFETLTLDIDKQFESDICADILLMNKIPLNILKTYRSDIIWASPPCQGFTVAQLGKNWKQSNIPQTDVAKLGMKLLEKTISVISELKPKYWFIENPRGKMRKVIDILFDKYGISEYSRRTVTYCQYGDTRMKPTDIWTNCFNWKPREVCKNGSPCHERAPRGSRTGTQGLKDSVERSIIPKQLCEEILVSIKEGH